MAWKKLSKRFIVKSSKDESPCPCDLGVCAHPPIDFYHHQSNKNATLWTGGRFVNMLIMVHVSMWHISWPVQAMWRHVAIALVRKSMRQTQAKPPCQVLALGILLTLIISFVQLISLSACLIFRSGGSRASPLKHVVLLCLEAWSALTPPSPRRVWRPSQTCIQLTDGRLPQTAIKHVLGRLSNVPDT